MGDELIKGYRAYGVSEGERVSLQEHVQGLRAGDVIVSFEGTELQTMEDLIILLRRSYVGDEVQLMVHRAGSVEMIDLTLGEN